MTLIRFLLALGFWGFAGFGLGNRPLVFKGTAPGVGQNVDDRKLHM